MLGSPASRAGPHLPCLGHREVGNASRTKALGPPTGLNKLYLQINHLEWGKGVGAGSLEESKSLASLLFPSP